LDDEENIKYVKNYKESNEKTPSVFALLAYENGLLINLFLENKELMTHPFSVPRREFNIDLETNSVEIMQYLWGLEA
tara:strand:- start:3052 stop:3282 length:231 start_codon:yes stop_codon:yes gene_type:complete